MKLIVLFVFLYSGLTLAKSRIGEWAAYDYEESTPETSVKGTLIKEIVNEKKMKSPDGKLVTYLLVNETLNFEVESKSTSKWVPESNYFNGVELNAFLLLCRINDTMGSIEKIKVKAGKFTACRVKNQDTWVGVVPFSHLLYIFNDGQHFKRMELIKFSWKKKSKYN